MWNTFKYTTISLLREKGVLLWALLFPIVLATLFNVMFSGLDEAHDFEPIPTIVVKDANYENTEAFSTMIDTLNEEGEDRLIDVRFVADETEARTLLENGDRTGYISLDTEGVPSLHLSNAQRLQTSASINETILKDVLDRYLHMRANFDTIVGDNPLVLADSGVIDVLLESHRYTEEISVTANTSSESVRYFYALLGFSAIMAANVSLAAITRTQPNLSALGARRAIGASSRTKTLTATFAASWLLAFFCLLVGFAYIRFILGIDFGGRDVECVVGLVFASLMSTALGTAIGSIPRIPEGAKSGILTGLSCTLALFAGLYGTSSQRLADDLANTAPFFQAANPSKQVADLFYSLYYYDSLDRFCAIIGGILIITAVLALITALFMRRQRYASL